MDKSDHNDDFYTKKLQVVLSDRIIINHDSYMFKFTFKNENERLGMQVAQHLLIQYLIYLKISGQNLKGEIVSRKYTATEEGPGYFLIPIKIYRPATHPVYPDGGELTPWLETVALNTIITIKRCIGKLLYEHGLFLIRPKENKVKRPFNQVIMCAGGTGITPCYQVIMSVCNNPNDNTKIILLFANKTEQDILLRNELEVFAQKNPDKFKLHYTIDKEKEGWNHFSGHINQDMLQKIVNITDQTIGLICGPKGFNKLAIQLYQDIGLTKDRIVKF